jgi:putative nucleotidyltransferase with HDIG domain
MADKIFPDLSESNPTVAVSDQRFVFPVYTLMLPAILDEIIHQLGAEGAVMIRRDSARGDIQVVLGRSEWNQWTGNRFRPLAGAKSLLTLSGQFELGHSSQSLIPVALLNQSPGTQYLAFTPIAVRGIDIGALWLGRSQKMSANEMLQLKSIGDILGNVMFCLSKEHQKDVDALDVIRSLTRLLAAWDMPTYQHSIRLVSWARATARSIGCPEAEVQTIGWAAILHDIGKICVPKSILHKPGPLTDEEWKVIKLHPKIGAKLIESSTRLHMLMDIILDHHEKMDGSGYPSGLKGMEIPLGARIIAVIDAYGAMTEERIYKAQFNHEQAIAEIRRCEGTHFDPLISEAFIAQFESQVDQPARP